jgi:hypothetical protein
VQTPPHGASHKKHATAIGTVAEAVIRLWASGDGIITLRAKVHMDTCHHVYKTYFSGRDISRDGHHP